MEPCTGYIAYLRLFLCCLLPLSSVTAATLPETSFSCEGKVVGGYYADFETGCQMFHVCTLGSKGEIQDSKFFCLEGTVFDQKTRVCDRFEEVVCQDSNAIYDVNLELYHSAASHSHKLHIDLDADVLDSAAGASVAHSVFEQDPFPPSDYSDDFVERRRGAAGSGGSGGTRGEVPLFRRRQRQQRGQVSAPPKQQAFSRFRAGKAAGGGSDQPPSSLASSASSLASSASSLASAASPLTVPTVPIIPHMHDQDHPRVVVTNGKPFVPQLNAEPAPKLEDPSLALPDTNFTCADKVHGGYYADPETDCRMYHICVIGDTITDYKFLCGNGTAYEQKSGTCQEVDKVDCSTSVVDYKSNDHLIIPEWLERLTQLQRVAEAPQAAAVTARAIAKRDGEQESQPHRTPTILRRHSS